MAKKKNYLKRIGIGAILLFCTLGITAWIVLTWIMVRPPSYSPDRLLAIELRSWPEHDQIYKNTQFPYVLSIDVGRGALEYIGALHTSNAQHPQLSEIESRWDRFNPTVVLCEGRQRMSRFSARSVEGSLSESQLVRILAYRNGLPLFSLEPRYDDEVKALLNEFDPQLVATYLTLRSYTSESSGVDVSRQDNLALGLLRKRTNAPGLANAFSTIEEFDNYWKNQFQGAPDWRSLENTEQVELLNEVGNVSREIRGQHMISTIVELVSQGERVFAVVGASHVIRQELELRRLIR